MYRITANQEKSEKIYFPVEVYITDTHGNLRFYTQIRWTCNSDWLFWYCLNSDSKRGMHFFWSIEGVCCCSSSAHKNCQSQCLPCPPYI